MKPSALNTYCEPEFGNVRYPSTSKNAVDGLAYACIRDPEHLYGLAQHHAAEIFQKGQWVSLVSEDVDRYDLDDELPAEYAESKREEALDNDGLGEHYNDEIDANY